MSMPAAQDFYRLRREGIGRIEASGSKHWTDYNTHDPGISILEVLAYAITELGYRTEFPVADLLSSADPATGAPYAGQAFYSARTILTVNPTTVDDLRRLLIDVEPVRNAWVRCKTCACDAPFFAWCEHDELVLSHDPSTRTDPAATLTPVDPRGLYEVLLELEADPTLGDLNDRTIVRRRTVTTTDGRRRVVTVEVRFPTWSLERRNERRRLARDHNAFGIAVLGPNRTKTGTTPVDDAALQSHWSDVFYVDMNLTLADNTAIKIDNASVRLFGDSAVRRETTVANLLGWLGDASAEGFVEPYRRKLERIDAAIASAKAVLHRRRNLDEDYCHVDLVEITDVAVCADVEVEATADIELVQAKIWFEIERYLDPPIEFWSLDERRAAGEPVEALFNGPELANGFLSEQGLRDTRMRTELRVSDILERLVGGDGVKGIEGLISVDNLRLTAYDADGNPIPGIADPTWVREASTGIDRPVFDPARISAAWLLFLDANHRPRLHRRLSRFLFASNGLPFLPRTDEAEDTLVQLHGRAARPKLRDVDLDLALPVGRRRQLESYHPVQHSFPLVYGIGPAGLPSTATVQRRAQASQLKAYLMVYEQLLGNAFAQLAHVGELFSLDPAIDRTYFTTLFDDSKITGYDDVVDGLTAEKLQRLVESPAEATARRNRFLDHLLARFGEQFGEHPMLLTDLAGQTTAHEDLIDDKISFLRALPRLGHDRGKAFNRAVLPCLPDNESGLQQRTNILLGLADLTFGYVAEKSTDPLGFAQSFGLYRHGARIVWFASPPQVTTALTALLSHLGAEVSTAARWSITLTEGEPILETEHDGKREARSLLEGGGDGPARELARQLVAREREILTDLSRADRYQIVESGSRWRIKLAHGSDAIGEVDKGFESKQAADKLVSQLLAWGAHKRAIVVEHLLLRPKFPGDALYPICSDSPGCGCGCGEEDPYSFRLTYVMPGWTSPFSTNMAMREHADRTIQEQTPSHLLVKTCWVGNDGLVPDPCNPVVDALAELLTEMAPSPEEACSCASAIYAAYAAAFGAYVANAGEAPGPPKVVEVALGAIFDAQVDLAGVCAIPIDAITRGELQKMLVAHFAEIVLNGLQFERFEAAWCKWVDADAAIDWTNERLQDTVVEMLTAGVVTPGTEHETLCTGAAKILAEYGTHFRRWIDDNLEAGASLDQLSTFSPPSVQLVDGLTFAPNVAERVGTLLRERYSAYTPVSYCLALLLRALADLRSTYPRATLHDCDEGSDFNPVRLGRTALGSS